MWLQSKDKETCLNQIRALQGQEETSDGSKTQVTLQSLNMTQLTTIKSQLARAEKTISMLTIRIEDQENHNRRNNIRIFRLRHGTEGRQPIAFFESWLPSVLGRDTKKGTITDRARRAPGRPQPGNQDKPRAVVIKVHNYTDKIKILAAYCSFYVLFIDQNKKYAATTVWPHLLVTSLVTCGCGMAFHPSARICGKLAKVAVLVTLAPSARLH